jgi:hypothetical protein
VGAATPGATSAAATSTTSTTDAAAVATATTSTLPGLLAHDVVADPTQRTLWYVTFELPICHYNIDDHVSSYQRSRKV